MFLPTGTRGLSAKMRGCPTCTGQGAGWGAVPIKGDLKFLKQWHKHHDSHPNPTTSAVVGDLPGRWEETTASEGLSPAPGPDLTFQHWCLA